MTTTALVTGANKGIGFEIVKQLLARGVDVYLGARDVERGEKAAIDTGARFVQLDVTDPESVRRAAASIERLDVLVNNAGVVGGRGQSPGGADLDAVRTAFGTNVFGVITVTDAFLPLLRESAHPRVVNVSSTVGSLTGMFAHESPIGVAYPPSKAALNAVTLQYAKALKDTAVKVNAVCPGYCDTDLNNHSGYRTPAQGARIAVEMATLGDDGPTGSFYDDEGVVAW
ncbi:SDR family oxidoreductase [Actinophytocola sp.]|uniref:SDR family oxidoreductase n=1 Tax=Actinophytocola sp. TaxID=1872138 RepID=UPI002D2A7211|nr:SDR family oxidoreductase [Actinophytocola sp.]HYQ67480.1 SDR family oxidoreductase [Actinophytocola sp.]